MSRFYGFSFLDLPHTSMVFCHYLFKDTTLCKSVCRVFGMCRQKSRNCGLYEYLEEPCVFLI
jgi:hypothetical protein